MASTTEHATNAQVRPFRAKMPASGPDDLRAWVRQSAFAGSDYGPGGDLETWAQPESHLTWKFTS